MTTKITESYRELNRELHKGPYGSSGHKWARVVADLCQDLDTNDVLDYGCGKGTLQKFLGFAIQQYDPAIRGLDSEPLPADIVVCTDVLEHVEPECLDNVIEHIKSLTKKRALFVIATRPAKKFLSDGRNAHLIVESADWWAEKIRPLTREDLQGEVLFTL